MSATGKQVVNGSKLNATNERVRKNEGDIASLDPRTTKNEGDIANFDKRTTKSEGDITNLRWDVTGIDGRATTVEANALGGGSVVNADGTVSTPGYTVRSRGTARSPPVTPSRSA